MGYTGIILLIIQAFLHYNPFKSVFISLVATLFSICFSMITMVHAPTPSTLNHMSYSLNSLKGVI